MSILDRISELRKANGNISINRLEKEAGLTRGSMSKWDDHAPSHDKLSKVADYFGVSVDYLLTGSEQKEKPTVKDDGLDNVSMEIMRLLQTADMETKEDALAFMKAMVARRSK